MLVAYQARWAGHHLTERAVLILQTARSLASAAGGGSITSDHILSGLLSLKGSVAMSALKRCGVILSSTPSSTPASGHIELRLDELALLPEAQETLDAAADEATKMGCSFVGSEHLLLALLRQGRTIPDGWPSYAAIRERILKDLGCEWQVKDIAIGQEEAETMKRERQTRLEGRLRTCLKKQG